LGCIKEAYITAPTIPVTPISRRNGTKMMAAYIAAITKSVIISAFILESTVLCE